MRILVINGSPKGKYSTTLHTALYLEKLHPEHSFDYLHAGTQFRALEKDFSPAKEKIEAADLLLFAYPVYTFLAPSQLHRFLAQMKKEGLNLEGKYASQISTSKHFYDITAHAYIRENCQDLGLRYINGLSADMDDLLMEKGQKEADDFFRFLIWNAENGHYLPFPEPQAAPVHVPVTIPEETPKKEGRVAVVADLAPDDVQLAAMIGRFRAVLPYETDLVNIHDFPFANGCVSCFNCSTSGVCVFRDGFDKLLRERIQTAKAIVIAFSVSDHSMGTVFKTYDDRQFCNGHRTVTMGMPFGYLVSGNYHSEQNLQTVVEARAEVGGNFLAGVATDERAPDTEIDTLAETLSYAIENSYVQPANFYGVGGMKIFRDLIWLMQGLMKADHRFYKSHGQYDFPQKKRGTMLKMYLAGALMSNQKLKAKMGNKLNEGMIGPYKKVLDQAEKQQANKS